MKGRVRVPRDRNSKNGGPLNTAIIGSSRLLENQSHGLLPCQTGHAAVKQTVANKRNLFQFGIVPSVQITHSLRSWVNWLSLFVVNTLPLVHLISCHARSSCSGVRLIVTACNARLVRVAPKLFLRHFCIFPFGCRLFRKTVAPLPDLGVCGCEGQRSRWLTNWSRVRPN